MSEWLTNSPPSNDVDEVYQSLKETIDRTMTEVIKKREVKKKTNTKPPWWNIEVSQAIKDLNYRQKQYKKRNITLKIALENAEDRFELQKERRWRSGTLSLLKGSTH